jgi:hypothetical protein
VWNNCSTDYLNQIPPSTSEQPAARISSDNGKTFGSPLKLATNGTIEMNPLRMYCDPIIFSTTNLSLKRSCILCRRLYEERDRFDIIKDILKILHKILTRRFDVWNPLCLSTNLSTLSITVALEIKSILIAQQSLIRFLDCIALFYGLRAHISSTIRFKESKQYGIMLRRVLIEIMLNIPSGLLSQVLQVPINIYKRNLQLGSYVPECNL